MTDSTNSDELAQEAKPKRGLLGSSAIVSMGTMLSRVFGLARDVVLANLLGAAPNADAFFVAFKVPNFLRRYSLKALFLRPLCLCLPRPRSSRITLRLKR